LRKREARTAVLFDKTLSILLTLIQLAGLPMMKPLHRRAAELLHVLYSEG
jgi:hypothetical protein